VLKGHEETSQLGLRGSGPEASKALDGWRKEFALHTLGRKKPLKDYDSYH
jgi:hypothetical protein